MANRLGVSDYILPYSEACLFNFRQWASTYFYPPKSDVSALHPYNEEISYKGSESLAS